MEENNKIKNPKVIDLRVVAQKIWDSRRLFYKVLPIVFVLSCFYILSLPRYYVADIKLAPELDNSTTGGTLSSIAASFGFDLGEMQTTDAISPLLYPDLMEDNGFVTSLFNVKVTSRDGEVSTTYYDYLCKHQQRPWWNYPMDWVKSLFAKPLTGEGDEFNPYVLNKRDDGICGLIRKKISLDTDKKTGVISIVVEDQDPLICKTMADSLKERLQLFITEYRTSKARTDYEYYKSLTDNAKQEYERARQYYGSLSDANTRVSLRSVELKMEDLENDMQLKYNTYSTLSTQMQAAKAKVQERTPAFTMVKGAAVPLKPAGPKRMLFVLGMLFVAVVAISLYSIRDLIFNE